MNKFNKQLRGSGYQVFQTKTKLRVENEDGEFLFYKSSIQAFKDWWIRKICR